MATSFESQTSESRSSQYVDFDEYIDYQLQKARGQVKWTDLLTAGAGIAVLVLAYLLVFVLFDHWIIAGGFGMTARLMMLGLLGVITVVWLGWMVLVPWLRSVNVLWAARLIEKSAPDMHGSLLNLVDLRRAGRPVPENIRRTLEKRAALRLSQLDVDQAIDRRPLMRISYALLAVVVLFCLYALFSPKKISNSVWRALAPTAQVAVATRTEILEVRPGDVELLARTHLEVTADLRGEPPESVTLIYSTADRKYVEEPVEMRPVDEGARQYRGILAGEAGGGILQNMTYRVEAGDARSPDYIVTVRQPPSARVDEVGYVYPDYMEFAPKSEPTGHIDAWEGTKVTVSATANMPVRSAVVIFSDDEQATRGKYELPMQVSDGTKLRAEWKLALGDDGAHPRFYRIVCRNEAGETDPQPTLYNITVRPDQRPEVELLDPVRDIERPANAVVPLLIRARDPDFRLRFINLRVEKNGEPIGDEEIFDGLRRSFSTRYEFRLEKLNLAPGETITYWLEARDNKQPVGNRTTTPRLDIRIVEPASQEEVEQQLAQDKQRQDEKLEEARSRLNDDEMPDHDPMDDMDDGDGEPEQPGGEGRQDQPQQPEGAEPQDANREPGNEGDPADQTDDGQEGEGRGQQSLDPDGQDDDQALEKLIERLNEEQDDQPGEQSEPGDKPEGDEPAKDDKQQGEQPQGAGDQSATDAEQKGTEQKAGDMEGEQPRPGEPEKSAEPDTEKSDQPMPDGTQPDGQPGPDGDSADGEASKEGDQGDGESGQREQPKASDDDGEKPEKPLGQGEETPDKGDGPAEKREARGDEQGAGTPDDDPDAKPAENKLDRNEGEQPSAGDQTADKKPQDGEKLSDQVKEMAERLNEDLKDPERRKELRERLSEIQEQMEKEHADDPKAKEEFNKRMSEMAEKLEEELADDPEAREKLQRDLSELADQLKEDEQQPGKKGENGQQSQPGDDPQKGDPKGEEGKGQPQPGDDPQGDNPGRPDGQGQPGATEPQDQADQPGQPGPAGGEQPPGGDQDERSGQAGDGGQEQPDAQGGKAQPGRTPPPAEPNLDHAKNAANLVLKRLEDQLERGEVDPKLLEELGWTEEEMRRFADRMSKQLNDDGSDTSPQAQARRRQLEETLKNLDLRTAPAGRRGENVGNGRPDGGLSGGRRLPVPAEYREQYDAFTRSLSRQQAEAQKE